MGNLMVLIKTFIATMEIFVLPNRAVRWVCLASHCFRASRSSGIFFVLSLSSDLALAASSELSGRMLGVFIFNGVFGVSVVAAKITVS